MQAIGYLVPQNIENADALLDIEIDKPKAQGRDLLIKVAAVSVNPVDTKMRVKENTQHEQYKILGWDAVGEVVEIGDEVLNFKLGDKVFYAGDITRSGSNAQFQLVDERITALKPTSLSDAQAAALPLTAITAWELLFDRLNIPFDLDNSKRTPGANNLSLLILGAAGGVGSILTQLAARATNATVIASASRPESQKWVTDLGADFVINHHLPLLPQLQSLGIKEVTHVISLTHTDQHFEQIVDVLAPQGKLAMIDDPKGEIDIRKLKLKSLSLHWEMMFTRSMFTTWDIDKQHQLLSQVAKMIDDGVIKTTVGAHYGSINAANLKRAHAHIESGKAIGKIVLEGF